MPILPIVDLLILIGSGSLVVGFILQVITIVTRFNPSLLGFSPLDFVVITGVCFGLAITFVARTWLKLNEPTLLSLRSRMRAEQARAAALEFERGAQAQDRDTPAAGGARSSAG